MPKNFSNHIQHIKMLQFSKVPLCIDSIHCRVIKTHTVVTNYPICLFKPAPHALKITLPKTSHFSTYLLQVTINFPPICRHNPYTQIGWVVIADIFQKLLRLNVINDFYSVPVGPHKTFILPYLPTYASYA